MSTPEKPTELSFKEKEAKKKEAFRYVLKYPKIEWKWISWGTFCLFFGTFGETVMPYIIGIVMDDFEQ